MISVAEAFQHIAQHQKELGEEAVPLLSTVGRTLARPVTADADFPAFDRVTMDGIAINSAAFAAGQRRFTIETMQTAGQQPATLQQPNTGCIEIMTGAVLPSGADAVVPYEQCRIAEGIAEVQAAAVQPQQNLHLQGSDSKKGTELLKAGTLIMPAVVGILASVGQSVVTVKKLPRIAVCSTGDELVPVENVPEPHQIRRSNVYTLAAALAQQGITATLHHLPDHHEEMLQALPAILQQHDAVLFSGAVSMGKKDFLPGVLQQLGMQTVFHKVAQKPGKPLLFGRFEGGPVVFGFPGNPVSTLVCYHVFFRRWLAACLGWHPPQQTARLAANFQFSPALAFHLPVQLRNEEGILWANPNFGTNSGDAVTLAKADAIITLPAGQIDFRRGEAFEMVMM